MEASKSNVQPMVCKVRCGKSVRGAINYNENKVKEGKAECIGALNFVGEAQHLKFYEKLATFENLIERNTRAKTNTLHISLNFDVGQNLSQNKLNQIATAYMDKIGFGDQPYLVYQHHDAAHPHSILLRPISRKIAAVLARIISVKINRRWRGRRSRFSSG
jgi:hypothetical protein